ncbi:hypothetical protein BYI23_A023880 [Burkholderia sp. YI23]|nr:hypothetical protein BYI23_A023880 [Burkholderia sp. YI23]
MRRCGTRRRRSRSRPCGHGATSQGRNQRRKRLGVNRHAPGAKGGLKETEEMARTARDFRKLPSPVLPGSGAKGLSQPRRADRHIGRRCTRSTPVSSRIIKT